MTKQHTVRFTSETHPGKVFTDCGRVLRSTGPEQGEPCRVCREARIADFNRAIARGQWPRAKQNV